MKIVGRLVDTLLQANVFSYVHDHALFVLQNKWASDTIIKFWLSYLSCFNKKQVFSTTINGPVIMGFIGWKQRKMAASAVYHLDSIIFTIGI